MKTEYEQAKGIMRAFTILTWLACLIWAIGGIGLVVSWALGDYWEKGVVPFVLGFILALIFSNSMGNWSNRVSIIELQERLSKVAPAPGGAAT